MIVDESIGFTGGVGIADEWHGDARERDRVARHALPHPRPRGRRAARRVPRQLGRDRPGALRRRTSIAFPDQPKPGATVVQCVRGASETGWSDVATLFRTLLQSARAAACGSRPRTSFPTTSSSTGLCDAAERGRRGPDPAARARTPTSASCSSRAKRRIRGCSTQRRRALELPAVDAARQDHDGRRRRREHRFREPQLPARPSSTKRSTSSRSTPSSCRSSTSSSTKTSSAASASSPADGRNGRSRSALRSRPSARSAAGSEELLSFT